MCACKISWVSNSVELYGVHKERFLGLPGSYKENKLPVFLGIAPIKAFKRRLIWLKEDPRTLKINIRVFDR